MLRFSGDTRYIEGKQSHDQYESQSYHQTANKNKFSETYMKRGLSVVCLLRYASKSYHAQDCFLSHLKDFTYFNLSDVPVIGLTKTIFRQATEHYERTFPEKRDQTM